MSSIPAPPVSGPFGALPTSHPPLPDDEVETHREYLRKALQLGADNWKVGGKPFGTVIVKDGEIIAAAANSEHINRKLSCSFPSSQCRVHRRPHSSWRGDNLSLVLISSFFRLTQFESLAESSKASS